MTYRFKIQIRGIKSPSVWRIVTVPGDYSFHRFHQVIQAAFGWFDYHLYEFRPTETGEACIALPDEEFNIEPVIDSSKATIEQYFHRKGDKMVYTYDLGDNWVHDIRLMEILASRPHRAHCEDGQGMCPPEDIGGAQGYAQMKKAFDKKPFDNEYREWLGMAENEYFDPNYFSKTEAESNVKDACNGVYGFSEPDD